MTKKTIINNNPLLEKNPLFTPAEEPQPKRAGRPRNEKLITEKGAQQGLPAEETRASFVMKVETLEAIRNYAYTERISYKEAIDTIVKDFIDRYTKSHELLEDPKNKRS